MRDVEWLRLLVVVATTVISAFLAVDAVPDDFVRSSPVGFASLNSEPPYEYGPTISLVNGVYHMWYCSPGGNGAWDFIRYTTSSDGYNWADPVVALSPGNSYDSNSVCDPSVVRFHGVWFLYHTCINQDNSPPPPDGYRNNRICVATADAPEGPFRLATQPIIQDLTCPSAGPAYCVGQPSAVAVNDTVYVFYTNVLPTDNVGPNNGQIYVQSSSDGINFSPLNGGRPVLSQRDVDVKYDRASNMFVLAQGDVGSAVLTWSVSSDAVNWLPYNASHALATNPALPGGGTNNNPGLMGLPDGTFSGMTSVLYGSSYQVGWGDWHLYRTDIIVNSSATDCSRCVSNSCDWACSLNKGQMGYCAEPGSTDQANCCACEAMPKEADCSACAPEGCGAACVGAGYATGICGVPGSSDPSDCCSCIK